MINREDLLSGTRPDVKSRVLVTEMSNFDGYEIVDYRGIVWGVSMRSKDLGQDFIMGCKTFTGGELQSYTELCEEVRQRAMDRLIQRAVMLHANAVINFKFTQNMMQYTNDNQVIAYGNAVVIKPIKNYVPLGGLGNILVEFVDKYIDNNNSNQNHQNETIIVDTPILTGEIVSVENQTYVRCPKCGVRHKVKLNEQNKYYIVGLPDVDDELEGCQIHCLKCGEKFTIPQS